MPEDKKDRLLMVTARLLLLITTALLDGRWGRRVPLIKEAKDELDRLLDEMEKG